MKKNSLSLKISLWISIFFISLFFINVIVFFLASDTLISRSAEREIIDITEDVAETLTIREGVVYYDEDDDEPFIFFEDGTAFAIYQGTSLYQGQYPAELPENLVLQPYMIQTFQTPTTRWYIYDLPFQDTFTLRAFYNYRGGVQVYNQLLLVISTLFIFLAITSIGGVVFLVRKAMKPVQSMADTAEAISLSHDYSLRVPTAKGNDEVGQLTGILNQMLDQIEASFQREKDFSANVSHELRTPLTVIKAQLEYLESKQKDANMIEDIQEIQYQVNWMQKMIDEMMMLARLKVSKIIMTETIDMKTVMESVKENFQETIKSKALEFQISIVPEGLTLETSMTLLIRIFHNLIGNAIKFTPENGRIEWHASLYQASVVFTLIDTGIGISQDHLKKVFDPLFQADSSRSEHPQSLGIGLSMTKEIVELLQGQIQIESALNKGTRITFILPQKS